MNASTRDKVIAFSIHALTASGSFWAFLAIVAAANSKFTIMWWWLGVALFVDGIDGPLARKYRVKEVLPNWSGDMLDSIVDYMTFVMIPAFALYQSGFLQETTSFLAAALIVITSAIYYADTRMKTVDNSFRGFPVCWNMVVFTLFVIQPGWSLALGVVILSAVLTFVPIHFVHPVRVVKFRTLTLTVFALWSLFGLVAIYESMDDSMWAVLGLDHSPKSLQQVEAFENMDVSLITKIGIAASGIYLYCIGFVIQLLGNSDDK
ncbi:MAG: phosphatidylcholine/phosphatidylserine synthase [Pseudomonadota bacterium]